MNHKNVYKGLRMSEKADVILESVSDSCQKYNICINGSGQVNSSSLLSFFWESIADSQNKGQKLDDLLNLLDLKDAHGNKIERTLIKIVVNEVINNGCIRS